LKEAETRHIIMLSGSVKNEEFKKITYMISTLCIQKDKEN